MSSVHQVFLAVIRRFLKANFKKSIVLSYDICRKRSTALKQSAFFDLCDMVYLINLKQKKLNLNFQPSFYFRVYMGESFQGDKTDET